MVALVWCDDDAAAFALRQQLQPRLAEWAGDGGYAACVPFGRERAGVLLRVARAEALPGLAEALLAPFGVDDAAASHYVDTRRAQRRSVRLRRAVQAGGAGEALVLEAFVLAGDTSAAAWLEPLLRTRARAEDFARALLRPGPAAPAALPVALPVASRQVCACFDVSEARIVECLRDCDGDATARLAALQSTLRCGTQCGSCRPELQRLVHATRARATAP